MHIIAKVLIGFILFIVLGFIVMVGIMFATYSTPEYDGIIGIDTYNEDVARYMHYESQGLEDHCIHGSGFAGCDMSGIDHYDSYYGHHPDDVALSRIGQ